MALWKVSNGFHCILQESIYVFYYFLVFASENRVIGPVDRASHQGGHLGKREMLVIMWKYLSDALHWEYCQLNIEAYCRN